jgi:predicted alpha/beta-fold hydrolase
MPASERLGIQPFRPRWPWLGADLQTVRNAMVRQPAAPPGERLLLATSDGSGDRLAAVWSAPARAAPDQPTILLQHGLAGAEDSPYMIHSADWFLARGHHVVRLNLRGAGPSRRTCRLHYHAGRSEDLRDAINGLPDELKRPGVAVAGFSLGGNIALKFAAEYAAGLPVAAVMSVSAPIDLAATSRNMLRRRNALYNRHLLAAFREESTAPGAMIDDEQRAIFARACNFLEVDGWFVAPRNGFADAWDYYAQCNSRQFLADIRVPTLLIQARDDPIVPAAAYLDYSWKDNPRLHSLLPRHGGHVGFHGNHGVPWYLPAASRFLDRGIG